MPDIQTWGWLLGFFLKIMALFSLSKWFLLFHSIGGDVAIVLWWCWCFVVPVLLLFCGGGDGAIVLKSYRCDAVL